MGIMLNVLGLSPYLEVAVRRIYWSNASLINLATKINLRKEVKTKIVDETSLDNILEFLASNGVGSGALIVVHSSAEALKPTGKTPNQIIDELLALVGSTGTLAMPAFPKYKDQPTGIDRMTSKVDNLVLEYNVKKSIPWTGLLPYKLMRYPGAVRSLHPLNTMVAIGPLAETMMANNLLGEKPLPCGSNSSWNFCATHGAKIIALGVDLAHSLTMIHVAEDSYEETWPIDGWYRDRKFIIVDNDCKREVVVKERHPKWAMHFAERTLSKDLKREKLLASREINGILVEILDAGKLIEFLNGRKKSAYPYFMLPKEAYKNGTR